MPRLLIIEGCLKEQQEIGNKRRSAIVLTVSSENKGKRLTASGLQFGRAIFFLPVQRLYAARGVVTAWASLHYKILPGPMPPCFSHSCSVLPLLVIATFGFPLLNLFKKIFIFLVISLSPFQLLFPCPFSSSYACCFQKLSQWCHRFSSPNRLANHLLSTCGCHFTPVCSL